jgi:hypothetical protein
MTEQEKRTRISALLTEFKRFETDKIFELNKYYKIFYEIDKSDAQYSSPPPLTDEQKERLKQIIISGQQPILNDLMQAETTTITLTAEQKDKVKQSIKALEQAYEDGLIPLDAVPKIPLNKIEIDKNKRIITALINNDFFGNIYDTLAIIIKARYLKDDDLLIKKQMWRLKRICKQALNCARKCSMNSHDEANYIFYNNEPANKFIDAVNDFNAFVEDSIIFNPTPEITQAFIKETNCYDWRFGNDMLYEKLNIKKPGYNTIKSTRHKYKIHTREAIDLLINKRLEKLKRLKQINKGEQK